MSWAAEGAFNSASVMKHGNILVTVWDAPVGGWVGERRDWQHEVTTKPTLSASTTGTVTVVDLCKRNIRTDGKIELWFLLNKRIASTETVTIDAVSSGLWKDGWKDRAGGIITNGTPDVFTDEAMELYDRYGIPVGATLIVSDGTDAGNYTVSSVTSSGVELTETTAAGSTNFTWSLQPNQTGAITGGTSVTNNSIMDSNGWSQWPLNSGRNVYVSSSGNDANDGLTEGTAKASLASAMSAMRTGFGDHLLLKRGDTWTDETFNFPSNMGLTLDDPWVISTYGTGARPKIKQTAAGKTFALREVNQGLGPYVFIGLHFQGPDDSTGEDVLSLTGGGTGMWVEDCFFEYTDNGVTVVGSSTNNLETVNGQRWFYDVTLRRNVQYHSAGDTSAHSQGFFASGIGNYFVIEENILDANGWRENFRGVTVFDHNCYVSTDIEGFLFLKNWTSRGSSMGLKCIPYRPYITTVYGNAFVRNGFHHQIAGQRPQQKLEEVQWSNIAGAAALTDMPSPQLDRFDDVNVTDWTKRMPFSGNYITTRHTLKILYDTDDDSSDTDDTAGEYTIVTVTPDYLELAEDIAGKTDVDNLAYEIKDFDVTGIVSHVDNNVYWEGDVEGTAAELGVDQNGTQIQLTPGYWFHEASNIRHGYYKNNILGGNGAGVEPGKGLWISDGRKSDELGKGVQDYEVDGNIFHDMFGTMNSACIDIVLPANSDPVFTPELRRLSIKNNVIQETGSSAIAHLGSTYGGSSSLNVWSNNKYYSTEAGTTWFKFAGSNTDFTTWDTSISGTGDSTGLTTYADPSRNLDTYLASLGYADRSTFWSALRAQDSTSWDAALTGEAYANYIRAGLVVAGGGNTDPPVIQQGASASTSVAENTSTSAVIFDLDTDPNDSDAVTWSLVVDASWPDDGDFTIDSGTGELKFAVSPDYEAPADANTDNIYLVKARATDDDGTDDIDLTITVTDVAEGSGAPTDDIHRWKLNNDATDSAGTFDGTPTGIVYNATDKKEGTHSADFEYDDVTDQIEVAGAGTPLPNVLTILAWVKLESSTRGSIFAADVTPSDRAFSVYIDPTGGPDDIVVDVSDDGSNVSTVRVERDYFAGNWVHVGVSRNGATVKVYANGALLDTQTITESGDFTTTPRWLIGTRPNVNQKWDGLIDDVRLFNRVLTDQEVSDIYNGITDTNPPTITSTDAPSAPENSTSSFLTLSATDLEGAELTWSLIGGADQSLFTLTDGGASNDTATLAFTSSRDWEASNSAAGNNTYVAQVQVTDGVNNTTQTLTITLTDVSDEGLIHHWSFDNVATDANTYADGTLQGGLGYTASAKVGTHALDLDGTDDYVSTAYKQRLGARHTAAAWIYPTAFSESQAIVSFGYDTGANDRSVLFQTDTVDGSKIGCVYSPDGTWNPTDNIWIDGSQSLALNTWNHVALTHDELGAVQLYVNGVRDPSPNIKIGGEIVSPRQSGTAWAIGARFNSTTPSNFFSGRIDDVRIYDDVLTQSEIQALPGAPNSDLAPAITSDGGGDTAELSINEGTAIGAVVTTATATDEGVVTFSLSGGPDAGLFAVDPLSGVLTILGVPDYESPKDANADGAYQVVLRATDAGGQFDEQTINITVNNVAPTAVAR